MADGFTNAFESFAPQKFFARCFQIAIKLEFFDFASIVMIAYVGYLSRYETPEDIHESCDRHGIAHAENYFGAVQNIFSDTSMDWEHEPLAGKLTLMRELMARWFILHPEFFSGYYEQLSLFDDEEENASFVAAVSQMKEGEPEDIPNGLILLRQFAERRDISLPSRLG